MVEKNVLVGVREHYDLMIEENNDLVYDSAVLIFQKKQCIAHANRFCGEKMAALQRDL